MSAKTSKIETIMSFFGASRCKVSMKWFCISSLVLVLMCTNLKDPIQGNKETTYSRLDISNHPTTCKSQSEIVCFVCGQHGTPSLIDIFLKRVDEAIDDAESIDALFQSCIVLRLL